MISMQCLNEVLGILACFHPQGSPHWFLMHFSFKDPIPGSPPPPPPPPVEESKSNGMEYADLV